MKTAYLVIFIDVGAKPPTVTWAGIFSEATPSIARPLDCRTCVLASREADTFAGARQQIVDLVRYNHHYHWVLTSLRFAKEDFK